MLTLVGALIRLLVWSCAATLRVGVSLLREVVVPALAALALLIHEGWLMLRRYRKAGRVLDSRSLSSETAATFRRQPGATHDTRSGN